MLHRMVNRASWALPLLTPAGSGRSHSPIFRPLPVYPLLLHQVCLPERKPRLKFAIWRHPNQNPIKEPEDLFSKSGIEKFLPLTPAQILGGS